MPTFDSLLASFSPAIYLPLQDASGTVAADTSGNGIDGTYNGTAGTDYALAQTSLVTGDPAGVHFLTGVGSVTVPFDARFNPATWTVGCMIRFDSTTPTTRTVMSTLSASLGWQIKVQGNTQVAALAGSSSATISSASGAISAATPYLFLVTWDANTLRVWLNTLPVAGATTSSNTSLKPTIGTSGITIQPNAAVMQKAFVIPNRALTALEIHQLYEASQGNTAYTIGGFPAVPKFYVDPGNLGGTASDAQSLWQAESNPAKPFATQAGAAAVAPRDSMIFLRQATYSLWSPSDNVFNNVRERTSAGPSRPGAMLTFMPYPGENPQVGAIQMLRCSGMRFANFRNMVADNVNGFATKSGCDHIEYLSNRIDNPIAASTGTQVETVDLKGATSGSVTVSYSTQPFDHSNAVTNRGSFVINALASAATVQTAAGAVIQDAGAVPSVSVSLAGSVYTFTWTGQLAGQPVGGPETQNHGYIIGNGQGGPSSALAITANTLVGNSGSPTVTRTTAGGYVIIDGVAVNFGNGGSVSGGSHHMRVEYCDVSAVEGKGIWFAGLAGDRIHTCVAKGNHVHDTGDDFMHGSDADTLVYVNNLISGTTATPITTHADWLQFDGPVRNAWIIGNEGYGPQFQAQLAHPGQHHAVYFVNNLIYNNEGIINAAFVEFGMQLNNGILMFCAFNTIAGQTQGLSSSPDSGVPSLRTAEDHYFNNYLTAWNKTTSPTQGPQFRTERNNFIAMSNGSAYDASDIVGTKSPGANDWNGYPTSLPTVAQIGTPGTSTATYYMVAKDAQGKRALPSPAITTTTGSAVLDATNYNQLTWIASPGAASYDILKGDTVHSVATSVVGTTFNDQGGATSTYSPPTIMEGQPQFVAAAPAPTGTVAGSGGPGNYMPRTTDSIYRAGVSVSGIAIPSFGLAGIAFVGSVPTTDQRGNARNLTTPCVGAIEAP